MTADRPFEHWQEAMELIRTTEDPITATMLSNIAVFMIEGLRDNDHGPTSDIDMLFVMRVMSKWCGQHEAIRRMLSGEISINDFAD